MAQVSTTISELNRQLHKLVYGMDRLSSHLLHQQLNLTFSQFRILLAIKKHAGLCQADIAKFHELTPAAISRQIELLKQRKLITLKKNGSSRREHVFVLTPLGKRQITKAGKLFNQTFEHLQQRLDAAERSSLQSALAKLTSGVQEKAKQQQVNSKS